MTRMLWFGLGSVLCAGCAHSAGPSRTTVPVASDTVWYVSARARDAGLVTTRLADSLEYGFVVVDHRAGGDMLTQDLGIVVRDSTTLTRTAFVEALRMQAAAASPGDPVAVLYVHGFGTWQHEALTNTATAKVRSASRIPWVVFCWPSKGSGAAAPSTRAIFTSGYWNDSTAAAASKPAFSTALSGMLDAVGGGHAVVVAHSMGSQLVSEVLLTDEILRARLATDRLRSLAFFAPDLDAARFHEVVVPRIQPVTKRLLLYASDNDRMLAFAKAINKSSRAGRIGNTATEGLEVIDVSDGFAAGGWFQRWFGSHHALSRASAVLFDLTQIVARERPPSCRSTLGTATLDDAYVWKLTNTHPPLLQAAESCATASLPSHRLRDSSAPQKK